MDVYLETPRLRFRRLTSEDEGLLLDLDSDPEVMRYINGGVPSSIEHIRERVLPWALQDYDGDARWGVWAALLKPANEFIGWFHFYPSTQAPHDIEVGYRLQRKYWGIGLASEGTSALIRKGFEEYGLARIVARTLATNAASRRVMEKAGMRHIAEADFTEHRYPGAPMGVWYEICNPKRDKLGVVR